MRELWLEQMKHGFAPTVREYSKNYNNIGFP